MTSLKEFLTWIKDWIGLLGPVGVGIGFFWNFWLKRRIIEIKELYKKIHLMAEEFRPNGGSTLRDAINRIEEKITVQEQKTLAIIKSLPLGTWISDKTGKFLDVNRSYCKIAGRTESELKGDNWSTWVHPEEREDVFDEWKRCVNNYINFDMVFRFVRSDGKIQKVHSIAYQLRNDKNELIGFLGTLYAIGEAI